MTTSIHTQKATLPVLKMSCAGCAANIQKILRQQQGVANADVNFASKTVSIEYDDSVTNPLQLQAAVRSAGYELIVNADDDSDRMTARLEKEEKKQYEQLKKRTLIAAILSGFLLVLSMTPLMHYEWARYLMWVLSTPVVFYCGQQFFIGAYKQAKHKSMNMDTLVALSTGIAYLFSVFCLLFPSFWLSRGLHPDVYFESAAVIITFILIGKLLEERAKQKTSSSIKKLIGLQPKMATLIHSDGSLKEVLIKDIRIGDILLVKSGEKIAIDGIIIDGHSFVDESMITGEPIAVEKQPEDEVFAGTINQQGSFKIKTTKVGHETLLAQIIRLVSDAQNSKAPIQKLVDKIASVFVPIVVFIALLSAIVWIIIGGDNSFVHGLLAFVTVLIIACPCALGLATPTAIMVGIGKGAELGILIKDTDSLERLKKVDAVVLDKTGTITKGLPIVTDVRWVTSETNRLQDILYSMEKSSGHPLADAIVNHLEGANLLNIQPEVRPGAGVEAKMEGESFYVGNLNLFTSLSISEDLMSWIEDKEKESKTVVIYGSDKEIYALLALADELKDSSRQAIEQLQSMGVEVIMATGDNEATAKEIAMQSGIKEYFAGVLPEDKLKLIKEKQKEGRVVAMAGDGINDSAALAQADVSIAMGKGSDIAIEVASVTIISGDLKKIPTAVHLSKATVATIRQNLFFAFIYNVLAIPIAAGVLYPINGFLLNPMIAGLAMALSSISVVTNSLRLKNRFKE